MSVFYQNKYYNSSRLGNRLKVARKKAKVNLSTLHELSSIARSKLSYLENGKIKRPRIEDILKIIELLKVDTSEIFNDYSEERSLSDIKFDEYMLSIQLKLCANSFEEVQKDLSYLRDEMYGRKNYLLYVDKLYGDLLFKKGEYEEALLTYESVISQKDKIHVNKNFYYQLCIAHNNALYKLNRVEQAKNNYILLLDNIKSIVDEQYNKEEYRRLEVCIQYNLALCLVNLFEVNKAIEILNNIENDMINYDSTVAGHYYLLCSSIMYYNSDWTLFKQYYMKALECINQCGESTLVNSAMVIMYILTVIQPIDVDFASTHREEQYNIKHTCNPACKKNGVFHRVCHALVHELFKKCEYHHIRSLLTSLMRNGHDNSMTHFLVLKLNKLTGSKIESKNVDEIIAGIDDDKDLSLYEKLYILASIPELNNTDRPQPIYHVVEEVYQNMNKTIAIEFLPEPLS